MQTKVWVGFDMDECLGQFLSLWPFCETLTKRLFKAQQQEYLTSVAKRIEQSDQHWLFRPGIDSVLKLLVAAQNKGKLYGCFILSNNGSQNLVECVRMILNLRSERFGARDELFRTGWSRNSPCRKGDMKKSLTEIQECLAYEGFPGAHSLMFFDDMVHVLAKEIPTYIKVQAYTYYTPVDLIQHILTPVFNAMRISPAIMKTVSTQSKTMESADLKDTHLVKSPPRDTEWAEATMALQTFLHPRSMRRGKSARTYKNTASKKSTSPTRKTTKSILWKRY